MKGAASTAPLVFFDRPSASALARLRGADCELAMAAAPPGARGARRGPAGGGGPPSRWRSRRAGTARSRRCARSGRRHRGCRVRLRCRRGGSGQSRHRGAGGRRPAGADRFARCGRGRVPPGLRSRRGQQTLAEDCRRAGAWGEARRPNGAMGGRALTAGAGISFRKSASARARDGGRAAPPGSPRQHGRWPPSGGCGRCQLGG